MSLIKQLWLTIIAILLLAFVGSLLVSVTNSRHYIEQEIQIKNADNANALALSISQLEKDPVTIELLIAAQFDTGYYRLIELKDPAGNIIERREVAPMIDDVPGWFIDLIAFDVSPGTAVIQDGWRQYGTLTIASQHHFAYRTLWHSTLELAGWFALAGIVSFLLAWWIVRSIRRPLTTVIQQARSISARRFTTSQEPYTLELREVVQAMNTLSGAVHDMLTEETGKLDDLRRRLQEDPVTHALNRETVLERLRRNLESDTHRASGAIVMVRVCELPQLNEVLGRQGVDTFLTTLTHHLYQVGEPYGDTDVGRLNGTDFLLILPGAADLEALQQGLTTHLTQLRETVDAHVKLAAGLVNYAEDDTLSQRLVCLDGALATAETKADGVPVVITGEQRNVLYQTHEEWRQAIDHALSQGVQLTAYPVRNKNGALVHHEAPSRLYLKGAWRHAGTFMPWVNRLERGDALDLAVLEAALVHIESTHSPLSINLSARSLRNMHFVKGLHQRLTQSRSAAALLWLELPEQTAFHDLASFRLLCRELQPLGVKIGLEHVGSEFNKLADLHDLGLSFLKFDASLINGIEHSPDQQTILRGMATLAHSLGILAIAEGVKTEAEADTVFSLGLDGVTGPGVR
jgi:EAL domain-containing protein (putative c-di-GMP-specific phosphodiesterase class I)